MNFKILTAVLICSIYHDRTMAQTASTDAIYCDLKTNAGCMNGGVCVNVFYSGVSHNRCFCPAGLNRPNCDYPVLMDSKQCSGSCPSGTLKIYFKILKTVVINRNSNRTKLPLFGQRLHILWFSKVNSSNFNCEPTRLLTSLSMSIE